MTGTETVRQPPPELAATGEAAHKLIERLLPIPRSLTGDGVRATLALLAERIPLEVREVPTSTPVLDWTVPREWNVREAWIRGPGGEVVADYSDSSLHLVGYSTPVRLTLSLDELRPHLHTLPDRPDWIPYKTAYYDDTWGFCLSHRQLLELDDGDYEVCIDASLEDGMLTYGECVLPGATADEVLIHTHVCHPAMANDNGSGLALATLLAEDLAQRERRHTFRFLFLPGTIGAITWLALNEDRAARIRSGLVLACIGDPGPFTYKRSRRGDAPVDRAVEHVLRHLDGDTRVDDFSPYGYDERQYCSPGFDLPVGRLSRTPHGEFPEYHTSADDLTLVRPEALADSFAVLTAAVDVLERNRTFLNLAPKGEPQLGRRGLYEGLGGDPEGKAFELAMLWVLNQSDGSHSLLDIAERAALPFERIAAAAAALERCELVCEQPVTGDR